MSDKKIEVDGLTFVGVHLEEIAGALNRIATALERDRQDKVDAGEAAWLLNKYGAVDALKMSDENIAALRHSMGPPKPVLVKP